MTSDVTNRVKDPTYQAFLVATDGLHGRTHLVWLGQVHQRHDRLDDLLGTVD